MPSIRKIVLHIGWPKTGTTTLQKHVFPQLPGYRYLGKTPFSGGKNQHILNLIHLLAYASREQFDETHLLVLRELETQEQILFGGVAPAVPWIISDEAVLSSLLKPSLHQHHGYSTASLEQIMERLLLLEQRWQVAFDILLVERDAGEVLHGYYAQLFHVFRNIPGLGNLQDYISTGTDIVPTKDLGFRYLRPGYTTGLLKEHLGANRIFNIPMSQLFKGEMIKLSHWYPSFPDVDASAIPVENKRTLSKETKLAHLRPIWVAKKPFSLARFMRQVKNLYKLQYASHSELEVPVRMEVADKEKLRTFMASAASAGNTHPSGSIPAHLVGKTQYLPDAN